MAAKLASLIKILTTPFFYKEAFRWVLYYLYEHVLPMKNLNIGGNPEIHPTVSFRFEKNIRLGDNVVLDMNCCLWASENSRISIGNDSGIGPGTVVVSSNHSFMKGKPFAEQPLSEKDIAIGNNVWIGANSLILAGASIGDGSVVGAGCVVARPIPPDSIVVSENRKLTILKKR